VPEPARSRRDEYSEATRQGLVDSARRLFAERGFSRTSTEEIVRAARVTKGALYHHFDGKNALFEAVMDAMEIDFQARVAAAYEGEGDAWEGTLRALDVFLDECADTDYGRVVFVEGPVALGWPRWRECEEKYGYRLTEALIRSLMDTGHLDAAPLEATSTVAFGMLGHVGLALAEAPDDDRERMKDEYRLVLRRILDGMRPPAQRTTPRRGRRRA
jgi:AcrR family transcriptional regulator